MIGGVVPAAWPGWAAWIVLIAALVGVSFFHGLSETGAWIARGVLVLAFLGLVVATYGPDN